MARKVRKNYSYSLVLVKDFETSILLLRIRTGFILLIFLYKLNFSKLQDSIATIKKYRNIVQLIPILSY